MGIAKHTNDSSLYFEGRTFPFFTQYVGCLLYQASSAADVYSFNVYGELPSEPTSEPTPNPTMPTNSPTEDPTDFPTSSPTAAPTAFPTPDSCYDFVNVTQPCCGHFDHEVEDIQVNLRNESLGTCFHAYVSDCCGTDGTYDFFQDKAKCDDTSWSSTGSFDSLNATQQNMLLCNVSLVNISQVDAFGTMVYGEIFNISSDLSTCQCMYVSYECEGEDVATCRSEGICEDLFEDDCWGNYSYVNSTWGNGLYSCDWNWTNETCFTEAVEDDWSIGSLLWEPCGIDSFIGDVTVVEGISDENLDVTGDDCKCTYQVRDCRLLANPAATECSESDCQTGDCYTETVMPCCGYSVTESFNGSFDIVSPEYDEWGYPDNDSWTCDNGEADLCPDVMNGTREYTSTNNIGWFYDGASASISSQCTCLYVFDECNLPTKSPTADPTMSPISPTIMPTPQPTELDSSEDGNGAYTVALYATMMIVSFASVFVV